MIRRRLQYSNKRMLPQIIPNIKTEYPNKILGPYKHALHNVHSRDKFIL